MTVLFSPFGNSQYVDANGAPAVGYTVESFAAGSSSPLATYTDSTGLTANATTVTLNAAGLNPAGQFWLTSGLSYKFIVKDADGVVVQTVNGVTGVNDPAVVSTTDQWVAYAGTPTYISATSFSVPGDQTSTLQVGRRVKTTNTSGTVYSTISASVFGVVTTVTVANDSGTLDSGLSAVAYGLVTPSNTSLPGWPAFSAGSAVNQSITSGVETQVILGTEIFDTNGCFSGSRFTPNVPGYYQINGAVSGIATNGTVYLAAIYKNGTNYTRGGVLQIAANSVAQWVTVSEVIYMNGTTDYVELYGAVTGTSPFFNFGSGAANSRFSGAMVRVP
jgi:hypothetical protein